MKKIYNTISLCNNCLKEVPAEVFEDEGMVFIKKRCAEHGEFRGLLEKDADFYRWFINIPPEDHSSPRSLLIPITFRCNMKCKYCYACFPERKDLSLEKIIEAVKGFSGGNIDLTGGEPTVRDDLESVIAEIRQLGKKVQIVTNGLKLSDPAYLKRLIDAGLDNVFFSFDSFKGSFYGSFKEGCTEKQAILDLKKRALENLDKEKIPTVLAATIYPGLNDGEIKDLFVFALEKSDFIYQLRLINCIKPEYSNSSNIGGYFLSELVDIFSRQVGIKKETLKTKFIKSRAGRRLIVEFKGLNIHFAGAHNIENIDIEMQRSPCLYLCHDNTVCDLLVGFARDGINYSDAALPTFSV